MPKPIYGLTPVTVENFGGLNTVLDPSSCPLTVSPDCQDVAFLPGGVQTRPGLSLIRTLSGKINGLKSYLPNNGVPILMAFASGGSLYADATAFVALPALNSLMNATTVNGREYIAISDGKIGTLPLWVFDKDAAALNFNWASPEGPAVDRGASNMITVDSGTAGNIPAGVHKFGVIFVTHTGFFTAPSPELGTATQYAAIGAQKATVAFIPLGPTGTIRRILVFTAAGGDSFYYIPNSSMVINDNTTTFGVTVDFSDTSLLSGINVDDLFSLVPLPPTAGVTTYKTRLVAWGVRNTINNITSIDSSGMPTIMLFNLSWQGGAPFAAPLGWIQDIGGYFGGYFSTDTVFKYVTSFLGDGATAILPSISTPLSVPDVFQVGRSYGIRAWVKRSSGMVNGQVKFTIPGVTLTVTAAQAITDWQVFEATGVLNTPVTTADVLKIRGENTLTNLQKFFIGPVTIFSADFPADDAAWISRPEEPEAFTLNSRVASPSDGQALRCCFVLRDFLYLVKERSLHVTSDDGVNEPGLWNVNEVSGRVGTPSIRGVGIGDEWAIIAGHEGVFYFDGGPPIPLLDVDLQTTWNGINWAYGHLLEVKVDTRHKRIHIAVPYGSATQPDRQFVLDYRLGFGPTQRKWCPWLIPCNSMALVTPSGASTELYIGSNDSSGKIWQLDDAALSDNGTAINSYYQIGYYSMPVQALLGYLSVNLQGVGTASLRLYRGDQDDYRDLRGWTIDTNGGRNLERQIQSVRQRFSVRIGTNYAGHWFSLTELTLFPTAADMALVRGHNRR